MNYLKKRSFSIHRRNIQSPAIELYKFFHGLSPSIMKNVFHLNTNIPYDLRSRGERYSRNPKTVKYGTETISYLAPKIWFLVFNAIKSSKSLDVCSNCSIALAAYLTITCNISVSSSFALITISRALQTKCI